MVKLLKVGHIVWKFFWGWKQQFSVIALAIRNMLNSSFDVCLSSRRMDTETTQNFRDGGGVMPHNQSLILRSTSQYQRITKLISALTEHYQARVHIAVI